MMLTDRWTAAGGPQARVAPGWAWETVVEPAVLGGANGIVYDVARDHLLVTQVFGSQVTAIDVTSGAHLPFAPLGEGIRAPDDGVFLADGTFCATEPMHGRVSAKGADGVYRTVADDLPGINGITSDPARRRVFADEFRPGGRLWELDPTGASPPRLLADDLFTPNALAMGPDGALWFPQVMAGEIWRYDLDDGSLRRVYEGLAAPCAVKFDSTGALVTPESGAGRVTRIDLASGARETIAQVARGIDNIALGPADQLFISHFTDGRVVEWVGGAERLLSPSGLVGPYGLAARADGSILVADGLSVAVVAPDGSVERTQTLISDLPTLAIGVAEVGGEQWVLGQRGQVFRFRPGAAGETVAGHLQGPTAMVSDGAGGALVVERAAGQVRRISDTGEVADLATGLDQPFAAAVASDATVWVTTASALVAVRDGALVHRVASLPGCQGVALLDGLVVVSDPANRRVVGFDPVSGGLDLLVADAPISSPVADADLPHASAPLAVQGDAILVGCSGDGSLRRLHRAR